VGGIAVFPENVRGPGADRCLVPDIAEAEARLVDGSILAAAVRGIGPLRWGAERHVRWAVVPGRSCALESRTWFRSAHNGAWLHSAPDHAPRPWSRACRVLGGGGLRPGGARRDRARAPRPSVGSGSARRS